jgi:hypothetical protein
LFGQTPGCPLANFVDRRHDQTLGCATSRGTLSGLERQGNNSYHRRQADRLARRWLARSCLAWNTGTLAFKSVELL